MLRLAFLFLLSAHLLFSQNLNRYTDSLFNVTQEVTNGIYATAPELVSPYQGETQTNSVDLKYHLFLPTSDTLQKRPMLIAIHGGGFVSGNKEHDDMIEFCKLFAQRGYVTATIQYRLGMNMLSSISGERSVYRGLQDGRAAIRFFKDNSSNYGIDTNNIFLVGSSAGAFISLHNLFLNEESEKPDGAKLITNFPPTSDDGPDLGTLDAINPTLHYGSQPNGVISLWGAIQDTTLIKDSDGDIPLLLVHGTDDEIVPFDVGSPFNASSLPPTYGSKPISERLSTISKNAETYFVSGEGHEFYGVVNGNWNPEPNEYWYIIAEKTTNFLWNIHKPHANFGVAEANSYGLLQYTDSSSNATKWLWDFGDGETSTEQNPTHTFPDWGSYIVKLFVQNEICSWDTTSKTVLYTETGVEDENIYPTKFELFQNYPNPFNPSTKISYQISEFSDVRLSVYNIFGQEVVVLVNRKQRVGNYEVEFNASNLTSGVYFYKLQSGSYTESKKMILLK